MPWEQHGFSVAGCAKNGLDALHLFKDNKVDIIISDVKMPQMDGIELLKKIHTEHPQIPFIFISGYDEFVFAQKAINNGAFAYLLKPIDVDELLDILIRAQNYLLKSNTPEGTYSSIFFYEERIMDFLLSDNFSGVREVLLSLNKQIRELALPAADVKFFCRNLLSKYLNSLICSGIPEETFSEFDISAFLNTVDISEMFERFYMLLREISKQAALLQYKNIDKLIIQAKQYVSLHYSDPYLSMPEVADYVGLNPSYFSAEFTKHEKLCFIHYLTNLRITHSKRLLTLTDDKIQIVSEAVGYLNATYYSTLFKRAEGITPSQYRKNHLIE